MKDIKTDTAERKRIDPLKTIVDQDLLRMASDMYRLKQNEAYWKEVPVPTRPLGQVRHETALQIGVFALPVIAYLGAALYFGFGHALWGLPVYYGIFHVLEKTLLKRILKTRQEEEDRDRGRYAFTKILGERLGLKPEEVTLDVVLKMASDFGLLVLYGRKMPEERKADIMTRAYKIGDYKARLDFVCAELVETEHLAPPPPKTRAGGSGKSGGRLTAAAAADSAADDEDASPYPAVNTTTGLPMMQNTPFDIGGNLYGTGTTGGIE
ncbi:hypothetical protein AB4Y45_32690 [Paraburkholderia sp. EG287A]|uniref:hypothetical protein n=1 Tax=Paraburkholderia sp. EG287A TaxID=3237012 RepID=UPI0034D35538